MGLFSGLCPNCFKNIDWFFSFPKNCSHCNYEITEEVQKQLWNSTGVVNELSNYSYLKYRIKEWIKEGTFSHYDEKNDEWVYKPFPEGKEEILKLIEYSDKRSKINGME